MMNKIKKVVSILIILCISLYGCSSSDLLNFDEPASKENHAEIVDALYIACKVPLLSSEYILTDLATVI